MDVAPSTGGEWQPEMSAGSLQEWGRSTKAWEHRPHWNARQTDQGTTAGSTGNVAGMYACQ